MDHRRQDPAVAVARRRPAPRQGFGQPHRQDQHQAAGHGEHGAPAGQGGHETRGRAREHDAGQKARHDVSYGSASGFFVGERRRQGEDHVRAGREAPGYGGRNQEQRR